jgi:hypothetical protein
MSSRTLECIACEAVFQVRHDMSDRHYFESYCVYCSEPLEIEEALPVEDDEEEDEIW